MVNTLELRDIETCSPEIQIFLREIEQSFLQVLNRSCSAASKEKEAIQLRDMVEGIGNSPSIYLLLSLMILILLGIIIIIIIILGIETLTQKTLSLTIQRFSLLLFQPFMLIVKILEISKKLLSQTFL